MLLTCKSCGNTYVIDDAEWARPDGDGKICEQCQEPLVPLIAGGAQQDSTTILEGYSFDGLQSSWRAQSGGAVDGEMEPVPQGSGWGEHMGSGSMSASVPLPGGLGSMAKPPPTGGYVAPPGAGGYGAPPGGYPGYPPAGGPAGAPMPTQALDPVAPSAEDDPNAVYIGSNERTMALDIDNLRGNAGPGGPGGAPPPTQALQPVGAGGGGGGQHTGQLDTSSLQRGRKKQVIIGGASRQPAHEDRTAAIDLGQASAYAAKMQAGGPPPGYAPPGAAPPGAAQAQQPQRPRPVPGMMPQQPRPVQQSGGGGLKVVLVLFFVLLLLGGGAAAVYFLVLGGGSERASSSSGGGGGGGGGDDAPEAFTDRLAASQAAASGMLLPSIAGEMPEDGQILLVSAAEGLFVEGSLLVPYSDGAPTADALDKGLFMPALAAALAEADPTLPIIVLPDTALTVEAIFPVLYTATSTGRPVFIGGSTVENPASVGTLELNPWQWPAPPSGEFATPTKDTDLRVAIGTGAVKLSGKQVNAGGDTPDQLTIDLLALPKLPSALASAKGANSDLDAVRFVPAPGLSVGKFVEIVQLVRGEDYNYPRFGSLYLEAPAKP